MKKYDSYKDSGIDWIGEIPSHWEVKKLKRVCSFFYGESLKSEDRIDEGKVDVYGSNGVVGKNTVAITKSPCIIIGRKGSYGKINYSQEPCFPIDTTYYIDSDATRANIRYLYYLLQTLGLDSNSRDSAVPGLSREEAYNKICSLPSSQQEQTVIANYLDKKTADIDKLILQKETLLEKLQLKRQAIINEAVTKGINPNVEMKDSGIEWLGQIPKHWEVKKLKYLISKIGSGVTPTGGGEVYVDEGIPLLRSQNIYNDGLRLDDVAYITEDIHESMSGSKVLSGDVLINITGASIGRCYYFDGTLGEANVNQHVCIVRPIPEYVNTKFLHLILCSEIGQEQIELSQTGANREGLNNFQLKNFNIPLPNIEEQKEIVDVVNKRLQKVDMISGKLATQIENFKTYRQSFISEVVTGKVKVI